APFRPFLKIQSSDISWCLHSSAVPATLTRPHAYSWHSCGRRSGQPAVFLRALAGGPLDRRRQGTPRRDRQPRLAESTSRAGSPMSQSLGPRLREERERRRIDLATIAASTKVNAALF